MLTEDKFPVMLRQGPDFPNQRRSVELVFHTRAGLSTFYYYRDKYQRDRVLGLLLRRLNTKKCWPPESKQSVHTIFIDNVAGDDLLAFNSCQIVATVDACAQLKDYAHLEGKRGGGGCFFTQIEPN